MADEPSLQHVAQSPAPFSTWLGTVILFLFFGVLVLALVGPASRSDTYEQTRARKRADNLKTLHEEDTKALATYAWVNKDKKVARIPIEQAMKLTIAELSQKKPAPAGPIASPSPQVSAGTKPAPSASASPSVAASATPAASPSPKITSVAGPTSEIHGQPAAAANPPGAKPGTQPGPNATLPASPGGSAKPATPSPSPAASAKPATQPSSSAASPNGSAKPAAQPSPSTTPGAPAAKPTPTPTAATTAKTPDDAGHGR